MTEEDTSDIVIDYANQILEALKQSGISEDLFLSITGIAYFKMLAGYATCKDEKWLEGILQETSIAVREQFRDVRKILKKDD